MGVQPAIFQSGGQASQHFIPGAYSRIDAVASGAGNVSINNGVIMGDSRGGQPNTLLIFSSEAEAISVLRDGPLLDAVRHAFAPGGGFVPQSIRAWRVNPGLQSSRAFKSSSTSIISALAWDWGLHGNQIQSKLETGTSAGKKLTVKFQTQTPIVADNIDRPCLQIQYVGGGSAAALTINATTLSTSITGDTPNNLSIDFASFTTIETLVNYINNNPAYAATILNGNNGKASNQLDAVTGADIKTAPVVLKANVQAIIDALATMPWIGSASFVGASRIIPDNDAGYVFMTGGTDGAYTSSEWTASLSLLEQEDIQFVGSSIETDTIHLMIKAHCESMNSVTGKSERQYILGGAVGESVSQVITRAKALASNAGALCYPEFLAPDFKTGDTKTWSPAYYAAKQIGLQTVLALNEPATNKAVGVLGWGKTLTSGDQEQLIQAGVWCGVKTKDGRFINVRSVTNYQGTELIYCEFSMMREALFAARDLRTALERTFIGRPGTLGRLADIDVVCTSKFSQYLNNLQIFASKVTGYTKTVNGDQIQIDYTVALVAPINFVFITSHFTVLADVGQAAA